MTFLERLCESKHLHTHPAVKHAPSAHRRPRVQGQTWHSLANTEPWRAGKKVDAAAAKRQYKIVQDTFRAELNRAIRSYRQTDDGRALVKNTRKAFDTAYQAAYRYGLKAAGLVSLETDRHAKLNGPGMDQADKDWLKSALAHERRYFHSFLADVKSGEIDSKKYTASDRVNMYAHTLDSVFNSGRVIGHPAHSLIYWQVDYDAEHCQSCLYLEANSPYTRETLPTVPRSGACKCLYNCKCTLRIVVTKDMDRWLTVKANRNRSAMVAKLAALKRSR